MTYTFVDFKNFGEASIALWSPLTVLIGRNGSGKTNTIEAVELLGALAHGRALHEISDLGRGSGVFEIRGGLTGCAREGRDSFELRYGAAVDDERYEYSIRVATRPAPAIVSERLTHLGVKFPVFATTGPTKGATATLHAFSFDNFDKGPNKPKRTVPADRSVLSQYANVVPTNKKTRRAHNLVEALKVHLQSAFVFDPDPRAMRDYVRIGDSTLRRNGGNLSAVLHGLSRGDAVAQATLERIRDRIAQVPDEPFAGLEFVETLLRDVILAVRRPGAEGLLDARVLSDGTLRALSVLTALETAPEGSRVVVEEFDNGLHPSRVAILADAARECANRRRLRVLVTTHNPATLDALPAVALQDVVLCAWDSAKRSSRLVRLTELPRADVLLEQGHLGDLITRRVLEQHLAPRFEEERREAAKKWLKALG